MKIRGMGPLDTVVQTPWLIGAGGEAARQIESNMRRQFPGVPLTCIGFTQGGVR